MIRGEDGSMFLRVSANGCSSSGIWDDGFGGPVTQIFIWHAKMINGIQTAYQRDGTTVFGEMHGTNEGNFDAVCLDGLLTRVSGRYEHMILNMVEVFGTEDYGAKVITSLKFETNTNSFGPFGAKAKETGEAFSYTAQTGICGFHGRCSKHTPPRVYGEEDIILPDGWIAAFGVYVNATATSIVGQGSLRSSTSLYRSGSLGSSTSLCMSFDEQE